MSMRSESTNPPPRPFDPAALAEVEPVPPPRDPRDRVELGRPGAALRTRDHAAIVYWTRDELLRAVVPYLREGLRAGDKVVYVAHDLAVDEIAAALAEAGVEVEREASAGRLALLTAADAFFPGGCFDVDEALGAVDGLAADAARAGFPRVRLSVEMTYALADVPGIERAPEFESRANGEVFARHPFVCICSFNASRDVPDVLSAVLAAHPILLANGIPLANPYYEPDDTAGAERSR